MNACSERIVSGLELRVQRLNLDHEPLELLEVSRTFLSVDGFDTAVSSSRALFAKRPAVRATSSMAPASIALMLPGAAGPGEPTVQARKKISMTPPIQQCDTRGVW